MRRASIAAVTVASMLSSSLAVAAEPSTAAAVETEPSAAVAVETEPSATEAVETEPSAAEAVEAEPSGAEAVEAEPSPTAAVETEPSATAQTAEPPARLPGDRMVQAGVGVVVAGVVGYGLMAVGLGISSRAENDLQSLVLRDDIEARRDVLARGQLGNRIAIAGAVTAVVSLAVGIPLIVVGRRRHQAAATRAMVRVTGGPSGVGLELGGRF